MCVNVCVMAMSSKKQRITSLQSLCTTVKVCSNLYSVQCGWEDISFSNFSVISGPKVSVTFFNKNSHVVYDLSTLPFLKC